jgi:hypothetical protein
MVAAGMARERRKWRGERKGERRKESQKGSAAVNSSSLYSLLTPLRSPLYFISLSFSSLLSALSRHPHCHHP